jgi:DNA-binding response OmpR family regulator
MTLNHTFEGLLVSQDVQLLRGMSGMMEDLSIQVDVCTLSSRANDLLEKREIDLLVVDWDTTGGSDLVRTISNTTGRQMTIVAIVDQVIAEDLAIQAGAHAVVYKPLTAYYSARLPKIWQQTVTLSISSPT